MKVIWGNWEILLLDTFLNFSKLYMKGKSYYFAAVQIKGTHWHNSATIYKHEHTNSFFVCL